MKSSGNDAAGVKNEPPFFQMIDEKFKDAYFASAGVRLYLANSIDLMNELPSDSIEMVFADPPYNLSNGGFSVHAGKRVSVNKGDWDKSRGIEKDFIFHAKWVAAAYRVLRPGGTLWVSGTYHSIYQCGYAMQTTGFHILNEVVWFKPNASPNLSCRFFTASHETLIWGRKGSREKHRFNYEAMKTGAWTEDKLKEPNRQMRSVWSIPGPKKAEKRFGKHPTQKPVRLLERVILASTNPGDVVLDPFAGSSTTGVAALSHRRAYIGVDLDAGYVELSKQRILDLQTGIGFGNLQP